MPGQSNGFTKRAFLKDKSVETYKEFIIGMMRSLGLDQPERMTMTEEEWKQRADEFWDRVPAEGAEKPADAPAPKTSRRTAAHKAAPKKKK